MLMCILKKNSHNDIVVILKTKKNYHLTRLKKKGVDQGIGQSGNYSMFIATFNIYANDFLKIDRLMRDKINYDRFKKIHTIVPSDEQYNYIMKANIFVKVYTFEKIEFTIKIVITINY